MMDPSSSETFLDESDRAALLARAQALNEAVRDLTLAGELTEVEVLARESIAIREALLPPDDPLLGVSIGNLGALLLQQGRYAEAEPLALRAVAIADAAPEPQGLETAPLLNTLAMILEMQGRYAEARPLFERALGIVQAALGENSPLAGLARNNLARLLISQGDHGAARVLLEAALASIEAEYGLESVEATNPLNNLGAVLVKQGQHAEARLLFERVLRIREKELGPDHPLVGLTAGNLGMLLLKVEAFTEARPLLERALSISDRVLGGDHHQCGVILNNLAWLAEKLGELEKALPLYERALGILEASSGSGHPLVGEILISLADLYAKTGRIAEARALIARATALLNAYIAGVFPTLAPAEQRAFVHEWLDGTTGFVFSFFAEAPGELPVAYGSIAGWKGLLLLGLRHQSTASDSQDAAALQVTRMRVAHAVRSGDAIERSAAEEERERLERAIANALTADTRRDPWTMGGLAALQSVLPAGATFVDLYEHARVAADDTRERKYSAVIVSPGAAPMLVDLGLSLVLEAFSYAWRQQRDGIDLTGMLAGLLWAPIARVLPPGTSRVWVAPDGMLSRIPWSTLAEANAAVDGDRGMLVAQVPSARALLDLLTSSPPAGNGTVFLVGGVDFGRATEGPPLWDYIQGTWDEVDGIAERAEAAGMRVRLRGGTLATPARVACRAQDAEYVHIATHGFFGGSTQEAYEARFARGTRLSAELMGVGDAAFAERSPLATSGLALAGANAGPEGNLTAEEIVGLDLRRARLVVLSACDTGRGAEVTGQGVLGLQAAVQAAGARALLMSLWPVPDEATAVLMDTFYRCLWEEGRSPAEALREAQGTVRGRREDWTVPIYWAGWALVGDAF